MWDGDLALLSLNTVYVPEMTIIPVPKKKHVKEMTNVRPRSFASAWRESLPPMEPSVLYAKTGS